MVSYTKPEIVKLVIILKSTWPNLFNMRSKILKQTVRNLTQDLFPDSIKPWVIMYKGKFGSILEDLITS